MQDHFIKKKKDATETVEPHLWWVPCSLENDKSLQDNNKNIINSFLEY